MRRANHNIATIVGQIVNAVGNGFAFRLAGEVMISHCQRLPPPSPTGILERTDQLLLFGIDANNWGADLEKDLALATKITKLPIAIWVVGRSNRLTVRPQRVLALPQQPRHGCSANLEALSLQLVTQFSERFARPLQPRQWVTGGGIFQSWSSTVRTAGSFFQSVCDRRPGWRMPLERWETEPWSSSRPRRMVVRLNPVISAKRVIPPRPCLKAKRSATWRRAFSSRVASSRLIA